jgi:hypothetical protein
MTEHPTLSNGEVPAPTQDVSIETDNINTEERQFLREGLFQLRNSFEWSDLDQDVWQPWSASILQWFKSPKSGLDTKELRIFRDILHAIATEPSLSGLLKAPCPVLTIVCLLRVTGYFSLDVRDLRVEELPFSITSGVVSLAGLPDTALDAYERMIETSWTPVFDRVLAVARTLQGAGRPELAAALVRELVVDPYFREPRVQEALTIGVELLEYDAEAFPKGIRDGLQNAAPSVQRKLVQRVFASKDIDTAMSFTRWLLSAGKSRCGMETVGRVCVLVAGSEGVADEEAVGLVARLIEVAEEAEKSPKEGREGVSDAVDVGTDGEVEVVVPEVVISPEAAAQPDNQAHEEVICGGGEQPVVGTFESECMADNDTEIQGFFASEEEEEHTSVIPAERLTSSVIRNALQRHVSRSGSNRGQSLSEESLTSYTNNLSSIPTDFFPFDPDSTLDWLEARKVPSSAGKFVRQIDVFVHCFSDPVEQGKYFGSVRQFEYAKSVFHEKQRCVNEEESRRRPNQQAMWSAKDEAMRVSLETLENNYEEKVKSAVMKMVSGEVPVDRWKLQDYFNIELYQERPPTRSKEYWLLQYNPDVITDETNYVSGDRLIIQTDKVSGSMGTYVYELTDIMKDTLRLLIREHQRAGIESGTVFQKRDGSAMSRSGFRKATYKAFAWLVGKGLGCRILRKIVLSGKTERGELQWPEQRREFLRLSRVSSDTAERHYIIRVSTPQEEKGKAADNRSGPDVLKTVPRNNRQASGSGRDMKQAGGASAKRQQPDSDDDDVESVASGSSSESSRSRKKARVVEGSDELDEWGSPGSSRADWSDERLQKWFRKHLGHYTRVRGGKDVYDWVKMAGKMNEKFGTAYQGRQLKQYRENSIKQGKW